jgi:hypothetical protein
MYHERLRLVWQLTGSLSFLSIFSVVCFAGANNCVIGTTSQYTGSDVESPSGLLSACQE